MRIGEVGRTGGGAPGRGAADRHDIQLLPSAQPLGEMRQLDRDLDQLGRHRTALTFGTRRCRHCQVQCQSAAEAQQRAALHRAPSSARLRATAGCNNGIRSSALYQSIILAVKTIVAMPAALTVDCIAIAESYSARMKWPSADKRMLRQKISSDCWPHSTTGRAALLARKRASRGTCVATSSTSAKNGSRRSGDKLFLFTGHSALRNSPGDGSHKP